MGDRGRWALDRENYGPPANRKILGIVAADGRPVLHPADEGYLAVSEEDAALIARAPELLDFVRRAAPHLSGWDEQINSRDYRDFLASLAAEGEALLAGIDGPPGGPEG